MKFLGKQNQVSGNRPRPLRIGIWCDYKEYTLTRLWGIGVFAFNLIEGLLALDEAIEIVMLVRQGDQHVADCLRKSARNRLQVIPKPWSPIVRLADLFKRVTDKTISIQNRLTLLRQAIRDRLKITVLQLGRRAIGGNVLLAVILLVGLPFAFMFVWIIYGISQFVAAAALTLRLPFKIGFDVFQKLGKKERAASRPPSDIAKEANCDVWLIPYAYLKHSVPSPAVVVIHDLVTSHYPEGIDPCFVREVNGIIPLRVAEATLCACMSNFIRETDLLGVLGLPPARVRMVPFAGVKDFPQISEERALALKSSHLVKPYIFYPAGIRSYKNQRVLIEALRVLAVQHQESNIDLVLTGSTPGELPQELHDLLEQNGLRERVHVMGSVNRESLASLYHHAFAVIVPSLYEQGSFPIYEGLHFRCPVACSNIPSLRDQCAPMGEAMLYFDPRDPEAVARTIITIRDHRNEIKARQQEVSHEMWRRTWKDAAGDWLRVFRDAIELSQFSKPVEPVPPAPWPHLEFHPTNLGLRPEVLLFLPSVHSGGVWEWVSSLVEELVRINKRHNRLKLTLALHADQKDLGTRDISQKDLQIEHLRLGTLTRMELKDQLGIVPQWPFGSVPQYCYLDGAMTAAMRADAWFSLVDRLPYPLLPVRPYGVFIHDLLYSRFPEIFQPIVPGLERIVNQGMIPTARAARMILVSTPQTRDDVQAAYGIDPSRINLIPVACEPHRRFQKAGQKVNDLQQHFILNVANGSPHKGAELLLRAFAILKERVGAHSPGLVICGYGTDYFSGSHRDCINDPFPPRIRKLVAELGLKEGSDMTFLGYVCDEQLRYLYEQCSVLVNAARYDNGSFSMIEGAYFGKPVISSRYPAAEFLCQRFGICAKMFPPDDVHALANLLEKSLIESEVSGPGLDQFRAQLACLELSLSRQSERIYDCLVKLAELGRCERIEALSNRPAA
jgi:glycosyltransferase involved in cell wall biosynthesis